MSTTIGTIELIAKIDTSAYKSGAKEIDRTNAEMADGTDRASSSMNSSLSKVAKIGLGAVVTAVAGAGALIVKNFDNAIDRVDTLNNSARTFDNMGFAKGDTEKAMTALKKSILGLPTALDEGVRGMTALSATYGDVLKGQKVFSALNNAILGFGGNTEMVKNAILQLSQVPMDGPLDAQTWNSLRNSGLTPVLVAMAKDLGISIATLKERFGDGTLKVQDFTDALIKMNTDGGGGMKSLEQIAQDSTKGIATGWANMNTAITRGIADIIQALGAGGIASTMASFGGIIENGLKSVARVIPGIIDGIKTEVGRLKDIFGNIKTMLGEGKYEEVGTIIGKALADGVTNGLKLLKLTMHMVKGWFDGIDWGELGVTVGKQAVSFLVGFAIGILNFDLGGVLKTLKNNWAEALIGLATIAFAPAKLLGPLGKILGRLPFAELFSKLFIAPIRGAVAPIRKAVQDVVEDGILGVWGKFANVGVFAQTVKSILLAPFRNLVDDVALFIRLIPTMIVDTFRGMVGGITSVLSLVKNAFINVFTDSFNGIKAVFAPITEFFASMFNAIKANVSFSLGSIQQFFLDMVLAVRNIISGFITEAINTFVFLRNGIVNAFSTVSGFFGSVFTSAFNAVRSAFGGVTGWFASVWSNITAIFSGAGTSVGNAIGGAFASVINVVLRGAVNIINGFIRSINGVVGVIQKIPGVGGKVGKMGEINIPQLATGGIVSSPTLAMIGEGRESEAVIPLSKLDKMLSDSGGSNGGATNIEISINMSGIMSRSKADERDIGKSIVKALNQELTSKGYPAIGGGGI